jgi:hypothetical protein
MAKSQRPVVMDKLSSRASRFGVLWL